MKQKHLKYYKQPSPVANLIFSLNSVFTRKPLKRVSLNNRLKDYQSLLQKNDQKMWDIHYDINKILAKQTADYASYDYGEGYFYQGLEQLGISGFRNTEDRVNKLNLSKLLQDKSVIDIGCNAGFILLQVSEHIKAGYGFDINPYLIDIANTIKNHLGADNCHFEDTAFEDLQPNNQKFDAVLSLANHSTYDQNTKQSIDQYFKHCADLLNPDGLLVFESHPPQLEDQQRIDEVAKVISQYFDIYATNQYEFDNFLDKNRTYFLATKKG